MARTEIPIQNVPAFGASLDDITFTAGDATNDHYFNNDGDTFLLMRNTDAGAKTADVIIRQTSRSLGKSGLVQTLTAAGGATNECFAGPFDHDIFTQPESAPDPAGVVYVDLTDDTGVSFAALRFVRSARA